MDFSVNSVHEVSDLTQTDFGKILLSAVEESLSSLGDSSKQAIFFHLESSFKIKKEEIPSEISRFAKALEGIFGPGASYLEMLIEKKLYDKVGLKFEEQNNRNFLESVKKIREHFMVEGECTAR